MFVSIHLRQCLIVAALGCFLLNACAPEAGSPEFLEQNWSKSARQKFYTTTQGSQMMPYKWFMALERADSSEGFYSDGLRRHGYIPNPSSRRHNPDGLPVGFAVDKDSAGRWIGMTCAACHTNQIIFNGTTMQIDGAPALADMYGLIADIRDSVQATIKDRNDPKFIRFAKKVLSQDYTKNEAGELHKKVKNFSTNWTQFVKDSTPGTPWGRARLDALGMIFNRISNIDLGVPANNAVPDAPVSYPFLWGTSWQNQVQWNGTAPNINSDVTGAALRLARNVGEVLGVFGKVDLKKPNGLYYPNTARIVNLYALEAFLRQSLRSPKWPERILGQIDQDKVKKGEKLFEANCASCHEVVAYKKQKTWIEVTMTPISEINTDPKTASNACNRMVDTAQLEGTALPTGHVLPRKIKASALVTNVVIGAMLYDVGKLITDLKDLFKIADLNSGSDETFRDIKNTAEQLALDGEKLSDDEEKKLHSVLAAMSRKISAPPDCGPDDPLMAYKGRPLDGIWATAPYLHNGSVANLYEILLPEEERMKEFYVGSQNFDPENVGFETKKGPDTSLLDTSKPGNSNTGHIYGNNDFSEDQRQQLVEYMKTL